MGFAYFSMRTWFCSKEVGHVAKISKVDFGKAASSFSNNDSISISESM